MFRLISLPLLLLSVLLLTGTVASAQKDKLEGLWYNEGQTAKIQIFKASTGLFYGKIVWLKEPEVNGKPRTDANNPDKKKKDQLLIGLLLLKGFKPDGNDGKTYEGGTIYDPKNGKTYSCKITHTGSNLEVRGYMGISLIGRTTRWTKAE